jgi:hypothetical protein
MTSKGRIKQEERRNGGQPLGESPVFIVMLPSRSFPVFLRSSVSLVQFSSWLFCEVRNFQAERTRN